LAAVVHRTSSHRYGVNHAHVLFRGDYGADDLIDVILGNRSVPASLTFHSVPQHTFRRFLIDVLLGSSRARSSIATLLRNEAALLPLVKSLGTAWFSRGWTLRES
jgi:hypothetical protein